MQQYTALYTVEDSSVSQDRNPNAFAVQASSAKVSFADVKAHFPLGFGDGTVSWYTLSQASPNGITWKRLENAKDQVNVHKCVHDHESIVVLKIVENTSRLHLQERKECSHLRDFYTKLLVQRQQGKHSTDSKPPSRRRSTSDIGKPDGMSSSGVSSAKISAGVNSAMGSFASWAKKGIAQASENFATVKMMASGLTGESSIDIGAYRVTIVDKLAEGGFSEVFLVHARNKAEDVGSHRKFAMKRCLSQTKQDEKDLELEVKLHRNVNHPNVMPIIAQLVQDSTRVPRGKDVYMLFPLYPGGSVNERMFTKSLLDNPRGPWPFDERSACRLVASLCRGVAALHDLGYLHRDIKPHNVMLTSLAVAEAQPVLIDLGSATRFPIVSSTRQEAALVQDEATVKCSAAFRSPEFQEVPRECVIGTESDVWSLGCTLYAMTYGRGWSPFEDPNQGVLTLAILNGTLKFPSNWGFSPGLETLLKDMMNTKQDRRAALDIVIATLESLSED